MTALINPTVLIIEDETDRLADYRDDLGGRFNVLTAVDFVEAHTHLRNFQAGVQEIDLILLDDYLPNSIYPASTHRQPCNTMQLFLWARSRYGYEGPIVACGADGLNNEALVQLGCLTVLQKDHVDATSLHMLLSSSKVPV